MGEVAFHRSLLFCAQRLVHAAAGAQGLGHAVGIVKGGKGGGGQHPPAGTAGRTGAPVGLTGSST